MKRVGDYINANLSQISVLRELTDKERERLRKCLFSIYKDIALVCSKYGLCFMLGGGSVLGAVRHKGFIPWDDDIDLMMPREDYMKFISVFNKELGNKYDLFYPFSNEGNFQYFVQVSRKDTILTKVNELKKMGVLIDITPIDYAPNSRYLSRLIHFLVQILRSIMYAVKSYKSNDVNYKAVMFCSLRTKIIYCIAKCMGFIFSIFPLKSYYRLYDKLISKIHLSRFMTIAMGRKSYWRERLPCDVFLPVSKGMFEGVEVNLPCDPDTYLRNLYGDYMQIPPVEKRERHFYTEFDLGVESSNVGQ